MRLIDLGGFYLLLGALCAAAALRRARAHRARGAADALFALFVWPLYVPLLLTQAPAAAGGAGSGDGFARIRREHELLLAALDAVGEPTLARLLPSREHLRRLTSHLEGLEGKVGELDEVLARDEFDAERAEGALRAAQKADAGVESARLVCESIARLRTLRERAARERDELLALCARLRTQVTVLRFAGTPTEDVGGLVGEILARVEGVGAVLDPGLESAR